MTRTGKWVVKNRRLARIIHHESTKNTYKRFLNGELELIQKWFSPAQVGRITKNKT